MSNKKLTTEEKETRSKQYTEDMQKLRERLESMKIAKKKIDEEIAKEQEDYRKAHEKEANQDELQHQKNLEVLVQCFQYLFLLWLLLWQQLLNLCRHQHDRQSSSKICKLYDSTSELLKNLR